MASAADRLRDVRYLHTCGERLGLTDEVVESAVRSYHRVHGTALSGEVDPALLGITLLYLAAKCADTPRDLRDCITVGVSVADPSLPSPIPIDERYRDLRESVIAAEQLVLRALRFDIGGDLPPRRVLLLFLHSLERDLPEGVVLDGFARFARTCVAILNDAGHSSSAMEWPPDQLAAGVMCLGATLENVPPPEWVEKYAGVLSPPLRDPSTLTAVVSSLLDLYESAQLRREELSA